MAKNNSKAKKSSAKKRGFLGRVDWTKLGSSFVGLFRFVLYSASFALLSYALLQLSTVVLRRDLVPDVSVPVSRFVANVDFETRTVELDATISKVYSSPIDITIWRMDDGSVIKSTEKDEIKDNEILTHTFEEAGVYDIGYSIIDEDNLSDEAVCTISFAEENEDTEEEVDEADYGTDNWISDGCGKSYTQYNSVNQIYEINVNKRLIRRSIIYILMSALVFVYTALFVRPKKQK
jgi:hypothetical protein